MKGMNVVSDNEILVLLRKRSEEAISALSLKYSNYCHSISYNILHSIEDADECVNDTFLRAWEAIPPANPNNLAVYLGTITRRLSLNRYRNSKAIKRGLGQTNLVLDELNEVVPDVSVGFEEFEDNEMITSILNQFLGSLPLKQRNIFVKRYWHLQSIEKIADEYKLSPNNIKQILFRIRKKLKANLKKEGIII